MSVEDVGRAKVINLDGTPPDEAAAETERERELAERRVATAAAKRAEFLSLIAGGKVRAAELPRDLISQFGFAVAGFALAQVLTGQVKITSAREAAELAKVGTELGRLESGAEPGSNKEMSPEERQRLIDNASSLGKSLQERRDQLLAEQAQAEENAAREGSVPASSTSEPEPVTLPPEATTAGGA